MAKMLGVTDEFDFGFYDPATGKDCVTEKVVDVTEDAPNGSETNRFLFLYSRDSSRRLVKMVNPYEGRTVMGSCILFGLDVLHRELDVAPRNDTFGTWARRMGVTKVKLIGLIERHAL